MYCSKVSIWNYTYTTWSVGIISARYRATGSKQVCGTIKMIHNRYLSNQFNQENILLIIKELKDYYSCFCSKDAIKKPPQAAVYLEAYNMSFVKPPSIYICSSMASIKLRKFDYTFLHVLSSITPLIMGISFIFSYISYISYIFSL